MSKYMPTHVVLPGWAPTELLPLMDRAIELYRQNASRARDAAHAGPQSPVPLEVLSNAAYLHFRAGGCASVDVGQGRRPGPLSGAGGVGALGIAVALSLYLFCCASHE